MAPCLPDVFLILVFQKLSANDRLSASQVCSNWYHRVREVNKDLRFLTIIVDSSNWRMQNDSIDKFIFGYNPHIKQQLIKETPDESQEILEISTVWNTLKLRSTSFFNNLQSNSTTLHSVHYSITVKQITSAFPAITELNFFNNSGNVNQFKILAEMLEVSSNWSKQLVTLRLKDQSRQYSNFINLYSDFTELSSVLTSQRLFKAINHLPRLTRLALVLTNYYKNGCLQIQNYPLGILSRLKEVRFVTNKPVDIHVFLSYVTQFAAYNPALQIDLPFGHSILFDANRLTPMDPSICKRIVRISSLPFDICLTNLRNICETFPHLTSLGLSFKQILQYEDAFELISTKLPHLKHFQLSISNICNLAFGQGIEIVLPVITSVKALEMNVDFCSHSDLQWLNLPVTMPNLETIHFESYTCEDCKPNRCKIFNWLNWEGLPDWSNFSVECVKYVAQFLLVHNNVHSVKQITVTASPPEPLNYFT